MLDPALLSLLQLASPALPVGAYSYSEGLEALVEADRLNNAEALHHWIAQELYCGAVRLETAVMLRGYQAAIAANSVELITWNHWLSAARETEELRSQSWQMGRSLLRLFLDLQPAFAQSPGAIALYEDNCHFAIAFAVVAAAWQIESRSAVLGYLYSWSANLVNAGVKLIPLGQTAGQQLLIQLQPILASATETILGLADDDLSSCGWGLALASMTHETQYSRLFRS